MKRQAVHGRWYNDACATAFGLEVLGERWSLLIVRELMLGGLRFTDLRRSLPGISAKVLTERLAGLETSGVLRPRRLPSPGDVRIYELTPWGYAAEPVLIEMGRWAAMSPHHNANLPLSAVAFILSLKTMFDPARGKGWDAVIGIEIAGEPFVASVKDGTIDVERGRRARPDAWLEVPAASVLALLFYGDVEVEKLEADAGLVIDDDRDLALRFVDLFHLPEKRG